MTWLAQNNWGWLALAAALGASVTWALMVRRVAYVETSAPRRAAAPRMEAPEITATFEEGPGASVPVVERPAARLGESALGASLASAAAPAAAADEPQDEVEIEDVAPALVAPHQPAKAEPEPLAAPVVPPGPYGEGSAAPLAAGAAPSAEFTVKGSAHSMLYHTDESPYYGRTVAEVWFDSESTARAAGFTRWDQR